MRHSIRPITQADVPFLWEMLYYAAHMAEDGAASGDAARTNPRLSIWVSDWGRRGDRGVIALDAASERRLGAAWVRLQPVGASTGYIDDETPELVIAVLPECSGQGLGSALLAALIEQVRGQAPAIVLTVRDGNPARRLYERHGFVTIDQVANRAGTTSSRMLLRFR
jgi:ribosomal protein S18 acetylase RimI-like enzyme